MKRSRTRNEPGAAPNGAVRQAAPAMPSEVELKLQVALGDVQRVLGHRVLASQAKGRWRRQSLLNVYYDSPDLRLNKARVALRLRRMGERWIQTIKGEGRVAGGLHERPEWETDTAEGVLRFDGMPEGELQRLFSQPGLQQSLQPLFTVEFSRRVLDLRWSGGAHVELAVDRGRILAGGRTEKLCELELELKAGSRRRLFTLARMLQKRAPLRLSNISKAERGYRMISGEGPKPQKAVFAGQEDGGSAGGLCRAVLSHGLAHLQANEEGVRLGEEPEFVHQTRVATRRLRSALKVFAPLLPPGKERFWREELRWLCDALDGARNWDVFVIRTLPAICAMLPQELALEWLSRHAAEERNAQRARAREALESPRYQTLVLELAAWLASPRWHAPAAPGVNKDMPATDFGARILSRRHRRLKKGGKDLLRMDSGGRHQVRIAAKKLRYAAEFLAPCFEGRRARRYLKALENLQDVLGDLNDEATTAMLMQQLSLHSQEALQQRACGLVLGWASGLARERLPDARKAWKAYAACKSFWPEPKPQAEIKAEPQTEPSSGTIEGVI